MFVDDNGQKYEFTSFRKEVYPEGGGHNPEYTEFTFDIREDALRRDFKCNAVYYDIAMGEIVDPLKGVWDIKYKILDTVKNICLVVVLGCMSFKFVKAGKKVLKIIFILAIIVFIAGTIMAWL